VSSEGFPQDSFEVLSAHVFVAYSNNSIACRCQKTGTCAVVGLLSSSVVRISLEFDDDAFAGTVEVNDETMQDVLPAKLQAEYAPIAQQRPRMAFGGSRPMAQRVGERESLRRSEATERIHRPRMTARRHADATRIPRVGWETLRANSPFVPPLLKGEGVRG
jgi:hypothetical protein